jgi:Putative adhesin
LGQTNLIREFRRMNSPPTPTRLALALVILLAAGFASRVDAEEYIKSYSVTGRATVNVHLDDGGVHVITSDTNQVEFRVKYERVGWGFGFGGDPHIDSQQSGDQVELTARIGWSFSLGNSMRISAEIHMPRNADLKLETGDGGVEIASLNGNITVRTSDGSIRASQLSGTINLRSSDGRISVDALKGDLKLHTNDGTIEATHLDGDCAASSNDGAIHAAGRFDFLDIKSGDGGVVARVESGSTMTSTWRIGTADGSVTLALPTDLKANLDASTNDGHITLNLPVEVQGNVSKSAVRGTLNGGGPPLFIHTGDGAIHVNRL